MSVSLLYSPAMQSKIDIFNLLKNNYKCKMILRFISFLYLSEFPSSTLPLTSAHADIAKNNLCLHFEVHIQFRNSSSFSVPFSRNFISQFQIQFLLIVGGPGIPQGHFCSDTVCCMYMCIVAIFGRLCGFSSQAFCNRCYRPD